MGSQDLLSGTHLPIGRQTAGRHGREEGHHGSGQPTQAHTCGGKGGGGGAGPDGGSGQGHIPVRFQGKYTHIRASTSHAIEPGEEVVVQQFDPGGGAAVGNTSRVVVERLSLANTLQHVSADSGVVDIAGHTHTGQAAQGVRECPSACVDEELQHSQYTQAADPSGYLNALPNGCTSGQTVQASV